MIDTEAAGERCVRCGEVDHDRRTLWMGCFYQMQELGLPFVEQPVFHAKLEDLKQAKERVKFPAGITGKSFNLTSGTVTCAGELTPQLMYTLRVCKQCRADWLSAIEKWYRQEQIRLETKEELKQELRFQVEQELEAEVRKDLAYRFTREGIRAEFEEVVVRLLRQQAK